MDAAIDLQTWQQAFEQHPISTTRTIERQLRASVSNNRERLRVLVGGNYRELLSTAEQIVTLDSQVKSSESHISEIGQKCKPPSQQRITAPNTVRRVVIAQLRLLQRCITVVNSALSNGDLRHSAELIVIARLLVKSLNDEESSLKSLTSLRERAASQRRQLLRRVDATLINPHSSGSSVANACCAYCLVTSASFQDVFKHVSRLRLERLQKSLNQPALVDQHIVDALRYYLTSLKTLAGLTSRTVTDALGSLQKRPILQEPGVIKLDLLDLRGIEVLIPEEIQTFIPYFKRTPFSQDEVRDALLTWSSDASLIIAKGLEQSLSGQTEVTRVLELRKALFATLLPVYFSTPGSSSMHLVIHRVLSDRVESLSDNHIKQLRAFSNDLALSSMSEPDSANLWEDSLAQMSLQNGASSFLHQVHRRRRGTSRRVDNLTRSLNAWINSTKALVEAFEELHITRWRDMLEEPDEEQEDEAEKIVQSLGKNDAQSYSTQVQEALKRGLEELEEAITTSINSSIKQTPDAKVAVEYLRTLREFMVPLREAFPSDAGFKELIRLIPRLHQVIAAEVLSKVCSAVESSNKAGVISDSIENLPSPQTFGFLRQLCQVMFEIGGTDVWSPAAVKAVRAAVVGEVFDGKKQVAYVSGAFDEQYLAAALSHQDSSLRGSSEQKKAAKEYWNRTKLLFGVLSI